MKPARFEVVSLEVVPEEVAPNETVTVRVEIRNNGAASGEYQAALLVNDSIEARRNITLPAGASERLTFECSKSLPGSYDVSLGDLESVFEVLEPANFKVYFLEINPNPVSVEAEVQAGVGLRNYGEAKGTYTLSMTVNDDVVGVEEIELMGGEEHTSFFSFTLDEPGIYNVKADDLMKTLRVIELVRPVTGTYIRGEKGSSSYGHLDVENGLDVDSLVVLASASEPEAPVVAVYVRAEDSCRIWPGRGSDRGHSLVYFACGRKWDNYAKEFTSDQTFEKFEEVFNFLTYNYDITLHPVVGGTADTEQLEEDEFPALD